AALFALAAPLAAQEPAADTAAAADTDAAADTARIHVVRPGDTLWDLSEHYYGTPWRWPRIHAANTGLVANPHLILPSWRIIIPGIGPDARADLLGVELEMAPAPAPEPRVAVEATGTLPPPDRTVFYPQQAGEGFITEEEIAPAGVQPGEFYAAPWLTEGAPLVPTGEVVDLFQREPPGQLLVKTAHIYDQVYVRYGAGPRPAIGQRLLAVRPTRAVDRWGQVIEPRAIVQVLSLDAEVMTVSVVQQWDELAVGDLLIPVEPAPDLTGHVAEQVVNGPQGRIIDFVYPQPVVGLYEQGFIDLGRASGVGIGDELLVIQPRHEVRGGGTELPSEVVARLRVVRVGEHTATTTVIHLTQPVLEPGLSVRLVGQVQ
ncbi:MAG TPA: LysM peptidoglycan-binding domain-containing protein, partial [Longimicrobiales bacterium]|nr:LysM peptidoglycan-binding domain-containing protein [Longimicrobiales bacterium]